jgi:hypothetical protein
MGGIGFLSVIFLYIVGSVALVANTPTLKYKILVLLAVLLTPSADAIYGRFKLNQLCESDGGLRVYKQPHNMEGYMTDNDLADDYAVKKGVFKFSESEEKNGVSTRVSMQNGELIYEKNVKPISKYKPHFGKFVKLDDAYYYQDSIVETYPEGEVIARDRLYLFKGGWAERFLGGFADAGPGWVKCEKGRLDYMELLLTLKAGDK